MRLPRPQLHLSTCIVLMFVAGGLMGANFAFAPWMPYVDGGPAKNSRSNDSFRSEIDDASRYGWPLTFYKKSLIKVYDSSSGHLAAEAIRNYYSRWSLSADIVFALVFLAAAAFVCEWLIRRLALKGPHKPAQGCATGATLGSDPEKTGEP